MTTSSPRGEPPRPGLTGYRAGDPFVVSASRRACDLVLGTLLVVATAPLLALACALVLLEDGGPLLFHQVRVGECGRPFRLTKLRTMRVGPAGPGLTVAHDPRITRVGAFLRRTSLDELPQLWNVLRGTMTLVGPRPESLALAERYPADCVAVLQARPGLTGPAQLTIREAANMPPPGVDVESYYLTVLVPRRTRLDLEYLRRPTLAATLRYVALTGLFVVGLTDLQE